MKKIILSIFISVVTFFVLSTSIISAKVISNENGNVTVSKSEVINDDLFVGAKSVNIDGVVNGDVFVGAESVNITGTINGNLHVGARSVDINGSVKGNVYMGAMNANVGKLTSIGGTIFVGAGTFSIDSQIKRNVYAGAGNLNVGENARIGKDFYYAAGNEAGSVNISEKAKVIGNIYKTEVDTTKANADMEAARKQAPTIINGFKITAMIVSLLGTLVIAFLYHKLFRKNFTESAKLVKESFWKSLGVGFLVTISFIPGIIILLMTVVGIPLAGMAFLLLMLYFSLSKIVVALPLGTWVVQKLKIKNSVYTATSIGILLVYIVKIIPVVGWLIGLVIFWVGLGALTLQTLSKSE